MKKQGNQTTKFLFIFILLSLSLTACKVGRFIIYNFADINDYKIFPSRQLDADSARFVFPRSLYDKKPEHSFIGGRESSFEDFLETSQTVAFLIIQNDTIWYENYFNGYDQTSIVPSFSAAKSVTSILIGCAIDDGLIKSVNEPVTEYIPELLKSGFSKISIKHLLQMTSGVKFSEEYKNPFGDAATFYYGTDLRKAISKMKIKSPPGLKFEYTSGNSQLLGLVLERALRGKSITEYFREKLWSPMGMEYDGSWSIDRKKNGLEKTYCCINARARDYAKIGRLYLNHGNWNGKQLVSKKWVDESTKIETDEGSVWFYQYQWWLPTRNGDFMAQGLLGQYIYVNPSKNLIVVRLGKKDGNINWWKYFVDLSAEF